MQCDSVLFKIMHQRKKPEKKFKIYIWEQNHRKLIDIYICSKIHSTFFTLTASTFKCKRFFLDKVQYDNFGLR